MITFDLSPAVAQAALAPLGHELPDEDALELYALIVWCHLIEPGDSVAGRMLACRGPVEALDAMLRGTPVDEVSGRELTEARKRWLPRLSARTVADTLRVAGARGITVVTRRDACWPQQLDDLDVHAPLCLWVRGDAAVLAGLQPSVAIVGARAASGYGDLVARELAAELAGSGIPVVSGGAYGIDGAAHRAVLGAQGLTVALLAGGAERAYPAGHTQLIDDIAKTGAVVSEVPCGSAPTKWRFLQRNRLIAALTTATIVVEAGGRSGSLNTANHAAQLGRALGAVPGPISTPTSVGTHRLIRSGAACITSPDDVRELLGAWPAAPGSEDVPSVAGSARTDDATRVRDALSVRLRRDVVDVARRAGMSVDDVRAILGMLRLEGSVEAEPDGWRLVASRS
ncbi:DNA-protecting protein DprA [Microbacterium sp. NEAU-LLC]|uniref:DNA-protecting protein DprA n=1 Tax=Microbacterium helvum TaxID=2773713 RepID=A0ABR8NLJ2_9MICO|nr:DNA-processing protein DprA [Microbacterium helvum]MBD3941536.1 DNA-protecting protein DprA [Microbacterium helvum]